jgi:hypothetical protein
MVRCNQLGFMPESDHLPSHEVSPTARFHRDSARWKIGKVFGIGCAAELSALKLAPLVIVSNYMKALFSQINADNRCVVHGNDLR